MKLAGSAIGALVGSAVGAAVWVAVVHFTGYEIGWIAWGVGLLAGLGAKMAAGDDAAPANGVVAAVLAVLAICAAKYVAVDIAIDEAFAENEMTEMTDEFAISYFADDVVLAWEEEGKALAWPNGEAPDFPEAEADYPTDVWEEAASQWGALSAAEKSTFKDDKLEEVRINTEAMASEFRSEGFMGSFGAMDLLFLGLAIVTAFKIGSGAATASET